MLVFLFTIALAAFNPGGGLDDDDPLQLILDQMAVSACCRFEFVSVLESSVFESVDSTAGSALIGHDGQYDIALGPDRYLRSGRYLYSYSGENNQVTKELVDLGTPTDETIRFITELDFHYKIKWADDKYMLTRKVVGDKNLPQMIILTLTEAGNLGRLFYIDDNDDVNWIIIVDSEFSHECDSTAFVPDFPDSAEIIKLY